MILDEYIEVSTNPSNFKHYLNKGYIINKCGEKIKIKTDDLPKKSHVKIKCLCSNCDGESLIEYHNYKRQIKDSYYVCVKCWKYKLKDTMNKKYGVDNCREIESINEKINNTNLNKYKCKSQLSHKEVRDLVYDYYGVDNISKLSRIKEIKRLKSIEKFGTNTPLQNNDIINIIREKHIKSGRWKEYDRNNYMMYRNRINYLTKKVKKVLIDNWNGYDYYDNEYIKDNFSLDKNDNNYPSIDHKISVMFGFLNNLTPEYISSIENLCITKRKINSTKFSMNENEFKQIYESY